jgi:hypothetical protein
VSSRGASALAGSVSAGGLEGFTTREDFYGWSSAFEAHTMGTTYHRWSPVQPSSFPRTRRRGITVLALLLLIIALAILAFFLIRYFTSSTV